ncbi:MAG: hypothetical protein QM758_16135 [Armatimonas sp.]
MVSRFLIVTVVLGALAVAAQAQTVYSNDFSANSNGFSTSGRVDLPTTASSVSPLSTMLGKFANNDFTTLSLSGLNPGGTYSIGFDLFIGGSWDGKNPSFGQDAWVLRENSSGQVLVNTTFSRINSVGFEQDYSDATPLGGGVHLAGTGADVVSDDPDLYSGYNIYSFGHGVGNPDLTFIANNQGVASLAFQGFGLQGVDDEYWAIDNIVVARRVPEPAAGLLALVALPVAGFVRRRK